MKRLTLQEVKRRSKEKGFIFLDDEFIDSHYKHQFKCGIDKEIHTADFNHISSGYGLKCCALRKNKLNHENEKLSLQDVKNISKKNNLKFLDLKYEGRNFKHNFKCLIDNKIYKATFRNISKGHGLQCCKSRKLALRLGNNNPNWNENISNEERINNTHKRRKEIGLRNWRKLVKERDKNICQICGSNVNINVHHLECYSKNKELRCDINNGICLDSKCHRKFHSLYGKFTNKKQFYEFKEKQCLNLELK